MGPGRSTPDPTTKPVLLPSHEVWLSRQPPKQQTATLPGLSVAVCTRLAICLGFSKKGKCTARQAPPPDWHDADVTEISRYCLDATAIEHALHTCTFCALLCGQCTRAFLEPRTPSAQAQGEDVLLKTASLRLQHLWYIQFVLNFVFHFLPSVKGRT